jgi:hypothetical protein
MKTQINTLLAILAALVFGLLLAGCSEDVTGPQLDGEDGPGDTPGDIPDDDPGDDPSDDPGADDPGDDPGVDDPGEDPGVDDPGEDPGDDPGVDDPPSYLFPGFENMALFVGAYWEYSWEKVGTTNGSVDPRESGKVRIELVSSVDITLDVVGSITLYETSYSLVSGGNPSFLWYGYQYFGLKDGVFYIARQFEDSSWGAAVLFDPRDGSIYKDGFIGYFSSARQENVYSGSINNQFINTAAVVVSEPFFKPECEVIAGTEICDDTFHDYDVKEYWIPGVGFGGFHRSGTSIFSGGGYVDMFQSTITIGLTDTNLN